MPMLVFVTTQVNRHGDAVRLLDCDWRGAGRHSGEAQRQHEYRQDDGKVLLYMSLCSAIHLLSAVR